MIINKPSKKIIALIVISLLVISFSVYSKFTPSKTSSRIDKENNSEQYSNLNYSDSSNNNISTLDTDGDGLPDWQEILTNTDPGNTDTDGDGTEDGKELELDRDPTIAGPDDKLNKSKASTDLSADASDDTTISEEISKNLFANAVYLSNNDGLTEENVSTLINNLINSVQSDFTYKEYSIDSLPIIPNPTKDDLRFFASTLATLQIKLLNDLSVNTDPADMSRVYTDHAKALYNLRTPITVSDIEIQIINNFSKVASAFDAFGKQKEDPLKLPLAVKAYQDAADAQANLIIKIGEYLDKNDIINLLDESSQNYWTLSISE